MNTALHKNKAPPKHLDLLRIHFPVNAVLSVGHRASGILLFLLTPVLVWGFGRSLQGPEGFAAVLGWFDSPLVLAGLFVVLWALVHHLLAGVRFLVLDLGIGEGRGRARQTAWLVFALEGLVMLAVLGAMVL